MQTYLPNGNRNNYIVMRAIKLRKLVGVEIRMVGGGGGSTFNSYLPT